MPMSEPSGQVAGLALKASARQAFCSVVSLAGSALGSSSVDFARCSPARAPRGDLHGQARAVGFARLGLGGGRQRRMERQRGAVGDLEGLGHGSARALGAASVPSIAIGLQLVGLNSKPGRSTVTVVCLSCTGMPVSDAAVGTIVGRALVIVTAAVLRVDADRRAHDHVAEVERAGVAGVTIERPKGAP